MLDVLLIEFFGRACELVQLEMEDKAPNNVWLNLFLTNQPGNSPNLAFGEIIVKALRAGLNSSSEHIKLPSRSLPLPVLYE